MWEWDVRVLDIEEGSNGLAISRTIIKAHGGQLWAENNPRACGAAFRFAQPVENGERRGARGE